MNEGAGRCHLPAPTLCLALQQELDSFHIPGESLLGVLVGTEGSSGADTTALLSSGTSSTRRTPLAPLTRSGRSCQGHDKGVALSLCPFPVPLPSTGIRGLQEQLQKQPPAMASVPFPGLCIPERGPFPGGAERGLCSWFQEKPGAFHLGRTAP